jgi:hypothetical protein
VSREFYHVLTDLVRDFNWRAIETEKLSHRPGTIKSKLLDEFGELPDNILFWENYSLLSAHAAEIYQLDCRKFILADDLHSWNSEMRQCKLVGFAVCDTVLSTYAYLWAKFYPELCNSKKVVWVPHAASPDFMISYNERPENSILLSGRINQYYPLRQQMKELDEQRPYSIAYHHHPGYHCGYDYLNNQDIGRGFARKINRYRAGSTDSSKYGYVVAKYFEIPATGALLFADDTVKQPLEELGFLENQHYLPVSAKNLEEQIKFVLDERNHDFLDDIRKRGQELVWQRHKTSDRARQIDEVCRA